MGCGKLPHGFVRLDLAAPNRRQPDPLGDLIGAFPYSKLGPVKVLDDLRQLGREKLAQLGSILHRRIARSRRYFLTF
jgi:hypothetical protein